MKELQYEELSVVLFLMLLCYALNIFGDISSNKNFFISDFSAVDRKLINKKCINHVLVKFRIDLFIK